MVISHRYKFIFTKTRRTAGDSLELFFSGACGEIDVLPPLSLAIEGYRPRNFDNEHYEGNNFHENLPAVQIEPIVPRRVWNDYFKFCVERNPWDKVLSHYFYHKHSRFQKLSPPPEVMQSSGDLSLDDVLFSDWYVPPRDMDKYMNGRGAMAIDRVLHYETLDEELSEIFGQLGVPFNGALDKTVDNDYRKDREHYRDILSPKQADRIAEVFKREIGMFGFTY